MPYSSSGGGALHKFHPSTWVVAILFLLILFDRYKRHNFVKSHLLGIAVAIVLVVWLAIRGKGALASVYIDVLLSPAIILIGLSRLRPSELKGVYAWFVAICSISAVIVVLEFLIRANLLPSDRRELFFRPFGLFSHPIGAGTLFCCAMLLALNGVVSPRTARILMVLFLTATALCGVRGPLAMAMLIFGVHIVKPAIPRTKAEHYVLDFGILSMLPLMAILAFSFGAFDRIFSLGLWESSSQSRFVIFEALNYIGPYEFWNGVYNYDVAYYFTEVATGGQIVENVFVSAILQSGFPAAFGLGLFLLLQYWVFMRSNAVFATMVLVVVFTTMGFGAKSMIAPAIAITGYWMWRQRAVGNVQVPANLA